MRLWLMMAAAGALAGCGSGDREPEETYQLVQALGNSEHVAERGLNKTECESRKADLKATATALGTYNEATGYGSITCLPEGM